MVENPLIMADADPGAVHKADTGAFSEAGDVQEKHHRSKHLVFNGYEAAAWELPGEFPAQTHTDAMQIKVFEILESV